jgi:hypothetical protein
MTTPLTVPSTRRFLILNSLQTPPCEYRLHVHSPVQHVAATICPLGKSAAECALVQEELSYLTLMVTGVEWLSEPDVPITVKVT